MRFIVFTNYRFCCFWIGQKSAVHDADNHGRAVRGPPYSDNNHHVARNSGPRVNINRLQLECTNIVQLVLSYVLPCFQVLPTSQP